MASGIGVKLPLGVDENDGAYRLLKTYKDVVQQNLKNLVLTNPGERIMDPLFGVGLLHYLFEQNTEVVYSEIKSKIIQQVEKYMPFIEIENLEVLGPDNDSRINSNAISVNIHYKIIPLDLQDVLNIIEEIGEIGQ